TRDSTTSPSASPPGRTSIASATSSSPRARSPSSTAGRASIPSTRPATTPSTSRIPIASSSRSRTSREGSPVSDWYKDAVFYEVHVKAFADGDGNGVGDFTGLIGRLDYLRDLGVDCLWILPMYPSPLRDDGYDIADFHGIHP